MASEKHTAKLTAAVVNAAQPRAVRYELADNIEPGLRIRVHPSGVKTLRWQRLDKTTGKHAVVVLGRFSFEQAAGCLTWPGPLVGRAAEGGPPHRHHGRGRGRDAGRGDSPSPSGPGDTSPLVKDLADDFYKRRIQPHRKRHEETKALVEKEITAVLGRRTVASITTAECARLVERVVDRGAKAHAGKVLGLLKQLFKFAEGRDLIQRNPAARLDPDDLGIVLGRRKRWLSETEIPIFWTALDERTEPVYVERHDPRTGKTQKYVQTMPTLGDTTRAGLRVLLLTGVRSGELLQAEWEHVDFKKATWTIPVANQKLSPKQARDAHPFVIPLVPWRRRAVQGAEEGGRRLPVGDGQPRPRVEARAVRRPLASTTPCGACSEARNPP